MFIHARNPLSLNPLSLLTHLLHSLSPSIHLKPITVYESLAVAHLNARIADRLCKDVLKSVKRKLLRYGRVRACVSIIPTAFYSNFVMYAASLTYDIVSFVPAAGK